METTTSRAAARTAPARDDGAEAKPKRLTLSNIVELLLSRGTGDRSHVTLTRNARGETQVEVRVSTGEGGEVQTPEAAEAKALEIYERVVARFPARETREQAEVSLTRNAKGETQVAVQIRGGEDGDVRTVEEVAGAVRDTYDTLRARYPMADGNTAKPGTVAGGERA